MNNCCSIYNHPFFKDLKDIDKAVSGEANFPKLTKLKGIIENYKDAFSPEISGIWRPLVVKKQDTDSEIQYVNIYRRAIVENTLNPCACSDLINTETPPETQTLDCNYCNLTPKINNTVKWTIADQKNNLTSKEIVSTYCSGANDVRSYPDDYLTKLPSLCNTYLTGVYDFKYLNQFPATANKGLGIEEFIKIPLNQENFRSLNGSNLYLCVDWRIQEKLGETKPDNISDSYYEYIDDHHKAYNRYLANNQTCGNFILLAPNEIYNSLTGVYPRYNLIDNCLGKVPNSGFEESQLPTPDSFSAPFGFMNTDHYNIFTSGNTKVGSYWKWNYTSGILCWYRYADVDTPVDEDSRIIPGIDLYIPEGDVFFATNDGPEPVSNSDTNIKSCPSGLKLITQNGTITGVIPSGSEFVYISQNLYHKAHSMFLKIHNLELDLNIPEAERKTLKDKFELACLLSTCPNYDEITVDMLLSDPAETKYSRVDFNGNDYRRIDLFNLQMLRKTNYKSSNNINVIKNKKDLLHTLVNKYGCYILFPPNKDSTLNITTEPQASHLSLDLDFEPVINRSLLSYNTNATGKSGCADTTITHNFYYDQTIGIGQHILSTQQDAGYFNQSCVSGNFTPTSAINTASIFFAQTLLDTKTYSTGAVSLENIYLRPKSYDLAVALVGESLCSDQGICNKQLAVKYNNQNNWWGTPQEKTEGEFTDDSIKLVRGYAACFFNPNISLCAFHKDGGVYYDSNVFGRDQLYFSKNVTENESIPYIKFTTKDVAIKLYSIVAEKLRDNDNPECKTLPLNHPCKCFDIIKEVDKPYNCQSSQQVFSNRWSKSSIAALYTPNLSTQGSSAITLKAYGDFSILELMSKFNNAFIPIPNHPAVQTELPKVNKIIDPLNPYECTKTISFSLPNYVYTKWNIGLNKYVTNHTDIWATTNQSIDVVNSTVVIPVIESGYFDPVNPSAPGTSTPDVVIYVEVNNPNYRRYLNKIELYNSSLTLYNKQKDILFASDTEVPTLFDIQITNPYLYALLETTSDNIEQNKLLYGPFSCHADGTTTYPEIRNYIHDNTIVLQQIPRRHLLMYKIYPISSGMGVLTNTFFHPNSGVVDDMASYGTSLVFYRSEGYYDFLYEQELFENKKLPYDTSGVMYRGNIDSNNKFVFDIVNLLQTHKKLRLYLKSGSDWFEYINPHIFGFYNKHNNNIYPGAPAYFEYTNYDKPKALLDNKTQLPFTIENSLTRANPPAVQITTPCALIPASPKINTKFDYINNDRYHITNFNYPDLNLEFFINLDYPKSIVFNSIRPYFLFDDYSTFLPVDDIEALDPNDERIFYSLVVFDRKNKQYHKYNEGPKNDKYSYEILSPPNYFDSKFSDLQFIINSQTLDGDGGIIYDSLMPVSSTTITLYDKEDPTLKEKKDYSVVAKHLIFDIVDKYGKPLDTAKSIPEKKYVRIRTVLWLDMSAETNIKYQKGYMSLKDPVSALPLGARNLITIYQNLQRSLYGEFSSLLSNRMVPYQTKWGDLINYDYQTNFDLNNSPHIQSFIDQNYAKGLYPNIFDTILVNQGKPKMHQLLLTINRFIANVSTVESKPEYQDELQFLINQKLEPRIFNAARQELLDKYLAKEPQATIQEHINYKGQINHVLHQKYNIESNNYYELDTDLYKNFLPIMDLYLIDRPDENAYGPVGNKLFSETQLNQITEWNTQNKIRTTGHIYISGVRSYTPSGNVPKNPKDYGYFILSLNKNNTIKPVLFDKEFYHQTLRIDDIYFPLLRNLKKDDYTLASGCSSAIINDIVFDSAEQQELYFSAAKFDRLNNNLKRPYFQSPVYCDRNVAGDPCYNQSCAFKFIGAQTLTAEYQHLANIPMVLNDISSNISAYAFGVDEGLYNFAHTVPSKIPYIQRFEIPPEDDLFNELSDPYERTTGISWSENANLKRSINTKYSYINEKYQKKLTEYLNSSPPQSELVKNTDILANEMLFRSLYGSKQIINLENIKKKTIEEALSANYTANPWSYLLQYTDVKTTPDKMYALIPYDYDKNSDQSRRKISGSISINGVAAIGKAFSVNINDKVISFNITTEGNIVYLIASVESETIKKQLGQLYLTTEYIFATELGPNNEPLIPLQAPANTTIERIDTCDGEELLGWSPGSYFTAMEYTDADGKVVDLVAEYKECVNQIGPGCNANPPPVDAKVISYQVTPVIGICGLLCAQCDSRGYAQGVSLPPNCQIIASTAKDINYNGLSRGTYVVIDELGIGCPPRRVGISVSPALKIGDFDDIAGGTPVLRMVQSSSCAPKAEICKPESCHSIDATDKFGKVFDPKRGYINLASVGSPCECRPFSFGYCRQGQSSCNECVPYAEGYPKSFDYSFENKYSKFDTTGHIIRDKAGEPIVHNGKSLPLGVCAREVGLDIPGDPAKHKATERCFWTQCSSKTPSWGIYKSTNTVQTEYNPLCPSLLATVTYDNNITTINLIGESLCISNKIRNDCPLLEVTLPDNTFTFTDTINSECTTCDVEDNKIVMDSQNPEWDIITETRTAILGIIALETDLNQDLVFGRGSTYEDKPTCGDFSNPLCCFDACYVSEAAQLYQCGKVAPDSWSWSYVLNCELNGSPDPSLGQCIHEFVVSEGTGFSTLVNGKGGIGFEPTSSNKSVAYANRIHWQKRMATAYKNVQACKNNQQINVEDIVEGVVPGSCGELLFSKVSFPATAYRQSLEGGESQSVQYTVDVAYYTYSYRRPRTIQDVLLGTELAPRCKTINPQAASNFSLISAKNIAEKYEVKTKSCQNTPTCYDTIVPLCNPDNYCCLTNKTDSE